VSQSPLDSPARKCTQCALVNFAGSTNCRRCGAELFDPPPVAETPPAPEVLDATSLRVVPITALLLALFCGAWGSLLLTSDAISPEQRAIVDHAITVLRGHGFDREVFLLEHVTSFRATDNWWNRYLGHRDAYASTNFPFEVMTLYPHFFEKTADDVERAIILLHEAQHLKGKGERTALGNVWKAKSRIGWTAASYGNTRVWKNTREWTLAEFPEFVACGFDGTAECYQ
jgi:hypothetical protein